jgi:hypothetical protein
MNIDIHSYSGALHEWTHYWEGLGGWVGAVGAILAVIVTWKIARNEYLRTKRQERQKSALNLPLLQMLSKPTKLRYKFMLIWDRTALKLLIFRMFT